MRYTQTLVWGEPSFLGQRVPKHILMQSGAAQCFETNTKLLMSKFHRKNYPKKGNGGESLQPFCAWQCFLWLDSILAQRHLSVLFKNLYLALFSCYLDTFFKGSINWMNHTLVNSRVFIVGLTVGSWLCLLLSLHVSRMIFETGIAEYNTKLTNRICCTNRMLSFIFNFVVCLVSPCFVAFTCIDVCRRFVLPTTMMSLRWIELGVLD